MRRLWLMGTVGVLSLTACWGVTMADINNDGVKERVSREVRVGGNNLWENVSVVREGRVIFKASDMCAWYETCRIVDIDPRLPGKEIVKITSSSFDDGKSRGKYAPNFFSADAYGWSKTEKKYLCYISVRKTIRQYKPGDFDGIVGDVKHQLPKYYRAVKQFGSLISAVKSDDWNKARRITSGPESGISSGDLKASQKNFAKIPSSNQWLLTDSAYEENTVIIIFPFARDYGIAIVSPKGVDKLAFSGGKDWD